MDEKERIEVEEAEVVETTDVEATDDVEMDVTPGADVDGGDEPVEMSSSQTEDGKAILGPEDDMDREITNPDGMPAPADLNVDKQINDENTGFMDELGKKFEAGVQGDAEKEGVHDENVEGIIAEIDKAMQIQHTSDNAEKDPEDPVHEELGGVDITENRENAAATALQERANANAKTEYTATGEPKELGEYMKEQNEIHDGNDLFGEGNDDHEVVNDKVEVMASTFDNSDSNVEGSVVPEGEAGAVSEDGGNTSELEANGDSENRSFEAGNSLTATEDEDEDFVPSSDDEEESEEFEDNDHEDDNEYDDDFGSDAENMETAEPVEDESFSGDGDGNDGSLTVSILPGTDKEVTSVSDLGETTTQAELVTPKGLLDENKEVAPVNTEDNAECCGHCDGTCEGDGVEEDDEVVEPVDDVDSEDDFDNEETEEVEAIEDEQPQMPGNNGNDMISGSNYSDSGEVDEHKDLAEIIREMDAFDAGMGIGDDAQNPTQFGDDAIDSEEIGAGKSYVGGDAYDRDACCDGEEMGATQDTTEEDLGEPVESDNGEEVAEDEGDYSEEATESIYDKNFSPWNW